MYNQKACSAAVCYIYPITRLSQQNREYYSLHFSEVQKELAGVKVELGKIE
jgi:hypothetical protein